MILQRNAASKVWGTGASAGATITLTLTPSQCAGDSQSCGARVVATTVADPSGKWTASIEPTPATNSTSLKASDGSTSATLNDVAIGDVIVCGGQVTDLTCDTFHLQFTHCCACTSRSPHFVPHSFQKRGSLPAQARHVLFRKGSAPNLSFR
jgi:hypothetical protein